MKTAAKTIVTTLLVFISETNAFSTSTHVGVGTGQRRFSTARSFVDEQRQETSFLLKEFTTYSGEVVQPYEVLGVERRAEPIDIRRAYIEKSKLYHPDAVRHNAALPSDCNSLDDVRDQWERIKLSYEILSDRRTRKRYDRHESLAEVLEDPSAVVARAAGDAVKAGAQNLGKGITRAAGDAVKAGAQNLGKGIIGIGTFAFEQLLKNDKS